MKLAPPANPNEYLMRYGQCHGKPKPDRRADSPKLPNLDSMDLSDISQPDEKDSEQQRMKPLLLKDQLNLRHAIFLQNKRQNRPITVAGRVRFPRALLKALLCAFIA
jgi:hypothetical protein